MSRRALIAGSALIIVGAGLLLSRQITMVEPESVEVGTASAVAFSAKTQWGEPDLSGVWQADALGARDGGDTFNLAALEALYTADARARMSAAAAAGDPTLRCAPPAFPRAVMLGRPIQILQRPGFAFVLTEAYPSVRIIPTTGRPHTEAQYLYPTYLGDSAAHWEGDTLVVDVISFNGETWLAGPADKPTSASSGAWPTSPALHVVERWRRIDADTLEYHARVEDPDSLSGAWETPVVRFTRQAIDRVEEALCRPEDGTDTYLERLGS